MKIVLRKVDLASIIYSIYKSYFREIQNNVKLEDKNNINFYPKSTRVSLSYKLYILKSLFRLLLFPSKGNLSYVKRSKFS